MGSGRAEHEDLKRQIERQQLKLAAYETAFGRLVGFVQPGTLVWYHATPHDRFAATVDELPRELGSGEKVVRLRDLDEAYAKQTGRTTVAAAALWALEPRQVERIRPDELLREILKDSKEPMPNIEEGLRSLANHTKKIVDSLTPREREVLATRFANKYTAGPPPDGRPVADHLDELAAGVGIKPPPHDAMDAVHEAHRILIGKRAAELLDELKPFLDADSTFVPNNDLLVRTRQLLEDVAGLPDRKWQPRAITEANDRATIDEWYTARPKTVIQLAHFVESLTRGYKHDYGTVIHAAAAAAVAAIWTVNATNNGGCLTGAQASCVPGLVLRHWLQRGDAPIRFVDYTNMLYPQYERDYTTISARLWKWLQDEAAKHLAQYDGKNDKAPIDSVKRHWQSIVDGKVPFGYSVEEG